MFSIDGGIMTETERGRISISSDRHHAQGVDLSIDPSLGRVRGLALRGKLWLGREFCNALFTS